MESYQFLPHWPLAMHAIASFGLLLLAGVLMGELVKRAFGFTRIIGYVLAGLLLGRSGLGLFSDATIEQVAISVDIAIGLVLFDLGRRLDLGWLRRDRWLLATSALECSLAFALIMAALGAFGVPPLHAAVAAAIGVSTSPATVMLVAREMRAEGQVTERALNLVAMNGVVAVTAMTMLLSWVHIEHHAGWPTVILHPLYLVCGSLLLAAAASYTVLRISAWLGKRPECHLALLAAMILATVGLAHMLNLSVLITSLAFGVLARNMDRQHSLLAVDPSRAGQMFLVVLFVIGGAQLQPAQLLTGGGVAVAYILARFAGKSLGVLAVTLLSGVRPGSAGWLCIALTPMSVLALTMVQGAGQLYPEFGADLAAIVLSALLILEFIGPLAVQYALRASGEAVAAP